MTLFIGEREITPTIITKGSGSTDKYKVGDRVNDDSNNPVGTVSSIFTDGNGDRYAVVCLDAVNRLASGKYLDNLAAVSGIPTYTDLDVWTSLETATTNTTAILATGASTSCSHCRSKSFIIDGVTYAGQLPNLNEVSQIFVQKNVINNQDPTASTYSSLVVPSATNTWSSSQKGADRGWFFNRDGGVGIGYGEFDYYDYKTQEYFVIPVLEIPLEN